MAAEPEFIRGNIFRRTDEIYHTDANAITEACMGREFCIVITTFVTTINQNADGRIVNQTTLPLSCR